MSGMAGIHFLSRGAFTSRGAKPNGLEFDAHGLMKNKNQRNQKNQWTRVRPVLLVSLFAPYYTYALRLPKSEEQFVFVCLLRALVRW